MPLSRALLRSVKGWLPQMWARELMKKVVWWVITMRSTPASSSMPSRSPWIRPSSSGMPMLVARVKAR